MKGLKPCWRVHSKSETTFGFKKNSISKLEDEKLSISHIEFSRILVAASLMKNARLLMSHSMIHCQVIHHESYFIKSSNLVNQKLLLFVQSGRYFDRIESDEIVTPMTSLYVTAKEKIFQITRWNSLKLRPW